MKKTILAIITALLYLCLSAQGPGDYSTLNAHSHNDYAGSSPFWLAYNNHFGSIEADIWAVDGELLVAHHETEIKPELTLDSLYIEPVVKAFRTNKGRAWIDSPSSFQLLIDVKTKAEPALSMLIEKLKKYPDVFDPEVNENAVIIVISGNRPEPSAFSKYPEFILFDGLLDKQYDESQIKRVPLFSENLKAVISWNGNGEIPENEKIRLKSVIDSVHSLNRKIRFWNAPDNLNAWNTFISLGIDYLNTDQIVRLAEYLNNRTGK
jgi:alkaline phosphatase